MPYNPNSPNTADVDYTQSNVNVGNEIPSVASSAMSNGVDFNDPNQIMVSIEDKTTPIVILFGAPSCGKTMTVIRMTRWLNSRGYTVSPVRTFRPTEDYNYRQMCDGFNSLVNSDRRANSTNTNQFMLLKVFENGRPICQILEAPGELYFDPSNPMADYPAYLNTLTSEQNRKVWCMFVEPDWENRSDRSNYVERIKKLKTKFRPSDRVMIMLNKIDKTPYVYGPGRINTKEAQKYVMDQYPGIFEPFKNDMPLRSIFSRNNYTCDFLSFQTGDFSRTTDGIESFQEGPTEYCEELWKKIMNNIGR